MAYTGRYMYTVINIIYPIHYIPKNIPLHPSASQLLGIFTSSEAPARKR